MEARRGQCFKKGVDSFLNASERSVRMMTKKYSLVLATLRS